MSAKKKGSSKKKLSDKNDSFSFIQRIKEYIMSINFRGNVFFLFFLLVIGILIPPIFSFAMIYFLYRCFPSKPFFLGRYFLIFMLTLFLMWTTSLFIQGMSVFDLLKQSFSGTLILTIIMYPFIYAWLWFDYNYKK